MSKSLKEHLDNELRTKSVLVQVRMNPEFYNKVHTVAKSRGYSFSKVVRAGLEKFLDDVKTWKQEQEIL